MNLTKLEIFGFKSFAQKAVFTFDDGLTGIIGPNGCGKSNIVDAIRWVLGEQRPSAIRCDRMENVIFNGTAARKPLSLAEVSMYIDNNKSVLPSEYSELKLTRRLYRSGESEYLINNQAVRLMDIINLFADTGMGADAYSVIELKMVEQILSENAQERRRLFEEAAGIKKYKARRRSALNKLDATLQELTRLDDIVSEVQKNVNSLARQVGKARRYHEYKQQLKEKDLLLSRLRIHSYKNQLLPLEMELAQVRQTRDSLGGDVYKMEAKLEQLQAREVEVEQDFRQRAATLHRKDEKIQELQNLRELRLQKAATLQEAIRSYQQEVEQQKAKIVLLEQDRERLEQSLQETRTEMDAAQEAYRETANQQLRAEETHQQLREAHQAFIQSNLAEIQAGSEQKEAYQKLKVQIDNESVRLERNRSSLSELEKNLAAQTRALEEAEKQQAGLQEELSLYQKEQEHLEKVLEEARKEREQLRQEIHQSAGKLEQVRSRCDFLANLIKNYEGFSQSVQYVMSHKNEYGGVVDTLANLVTCEEEYRPALESFLAEVSNYLVVEEVDTAREILEHLRQSDKGRMSLVPLPLLNSQHLDDPSRTPNSEDGTVALREIVSFPEHYEKLFRYLFRGVYLTPDISSAIRLHNDYPELTFVTRSGEILEHWGNLTGGSIANGSGLIGRKEQYERKLAEREALESALAARQETLAKLGEDIQTREGKLKEIEALRRESQQRSVEAEKQANRLAYEVERLSQMIGELQEEVAAQQEQIAGWESQAASLFPEIEKLENRTEEYQRQEQNLLKQLQEAETRLKQITQSTQERQIAYLNLKSREKEQLQRVEFIAQSLEEAEQFIADREQRKVEHQAEIEKLQAEAAQISAELETLYQERDELERAKNETEKTFQELKSTIQAEELELKKKQRLWNQARERLQDLELHIKELQVKQSSVEEQLVERYGQEALEFDIKDLDPSASVKDVQDEIESIRDKLERLGDVNPLAIKEHEKEKERLTFLTEQRDDLLSAKEQLMETIEKLNSTARKQFMEVFRQIQVNFQRVFREFFDGGSAELKLIESRDPLEANIDIAVTHKGKRLNTLTLLSAGEKTLTAISLLFAIYLVKPSPFCILDEVDAPLDDVNIGRFTQALRLFSKDTQFILVTHNKKTMEAANSLYGVTMEEQGVSKVVSVQFD